jgi:AhpD family alkylhydroperoxidase
LDFPPAENLLADYRALLNGWLPAPTALITLTQVITGQLPLRWNGSSSTESTPMTTTDYQGITKGIAETLKDLRAGAPDVMKGFGAISQAALKAEALDAKTKELIALAIGVAVRCDDCIAFHAKAAVAQGASDAEIFETLGMAIYMGAGPSVMYAAHAVDAVRQFEAARSASAAE